MWRNCSGPDCGRAAGACSVRRPLTVVATVVALALAASVPVSAWGPMGHEIIANLAHARLSPAANRAVAALLASRSFASVANDLDQWRFSHPATERWHFVDIPITERHYDPARDCQLEEGKGDCILAELDRLRRTLRDPARPESERTEALRFLIHLVGDLHNPLHAGDNGDRGGNDLPVWLLGRKTNLHAVWDTGLIELAQRDVNGWAAAVDRLAKSASDAGTPIQWEEEAHDLARDVAYRIPADRRLDQAYVAKARPVVELQLARAGVRLARLINELF
jgi:nuclease S1